MSKIRQNIIVFFLAAALVFTGNFAYALSHMECVVEESTHHACEDDCCATTSCCDEESAPGFMESLTLSSEKCCEVHIIEAQPQNFAVITFNKAADNIKTGFVKSEISVHIESLRSFAELPAYKISSNNIYLSVSNLRI